MKYSLHNFIILILSLKYINLQTISIPFKRIISPDLTEENFYSNYENNNIYTTLKLGTPPQEIKAQIKMLQFSLCVRNNSVYKNNSSSTYKKNGKEFSSYNIDYYRAISSNESFIIGNENKILSDAKFMLTTNSKYDSDGILGLQIHENNYLTYGHGLVSQLKLNNLINKEIFFFNFDTPNDEGELIIGDYPHLIDKFSDKYKKNQLETTGIHIPSLDILYNLLFRSVFWDGKEIETMIIGSFNVEHGYIIGSKYFEDAVYSFFRDHIVKRKCKREEVNTLYIGYICDDYDGLKIESFPNLIFYNSDTNFNLTVTYKDLFVKKGNKIFFMIVFDKRGYNVFWTLGSILLKSNMIVFDMDKRVIGFYDENSAKYKREKLNTTLYIVGISIAGVIIAGLIAFIIYKFVCKKKPKKAFELNEDYDYSTAINN